MRGNYALVALSVFLGACGPFCAGALAFSPGAWRMAWRARARSRSCASAVGRRWIKGAVNERAPEDCGALRYYKRSLVKQMRREGKGWWVLKKLGGEIEVSNPRKRVKLAPAAASLVTFSFALLLSSSLLYAALFPGFSMPSSYASFHAEKSNAASPEGIIHALVGGGSSEVSSVDGNELSSDVSASSALTFSSFSLPRFNRPRRPSRRLNPSKHKTLHRTISLRVGRRAALTNRARRAEALLAQKIRVALLAHRAAARRRRVLRPPKKMSFTRFSLIGSINACSFLVACASLRDICNTMPAWAISGMPRNGIPTCLFTATRLTP